MRDTIPMDDPKRAPTGRQMLRPMTTTPLVMRSGYVAMLDILGWKGIWKRNSVESVLDAINRLRAGIDRLRESTERMYAQIAETTAAHFDEPITDPMVRLEMAFLSDTIVLATTSTKSWENNADPSPLLLQELCRVASMLIGRCATGRVPLVTRGAVARGKFLIDHNLILGPAVDEAALLMNQAQAAAVWLAPSIDDHDELKAKIHFEYPLPLKGGSVLRARVVNPLLFGDEAAITEGMMKAFDGDGSIDVAIKRQATKALLDAAWLHRDQFLSEAATLLLPHQTTDAP